jgi:hypothetical protein
VVFDCNEPDSFKETDYWLEKCQTFAKPKVKIYLIANKTDLEWKVDRN